MKKLVSSLLISLILAAGLVTSSAVFADPPRMSINDAVIMVQQRFKATAVKSDTVRDGDRVLYRIRLMSSDRSRVWTVMVDAQTGQVL